MEANLGTTNLLLGIMAAVSVLEALLLIGSGVAMFMVYRKLMTLISGLEERHVTPMMVRVNAILGDVKDVTGRVKGEANRVDQAIHSTMGRVDDTVDRMRWNVRAKAGRIIGLYRGLRVIIEEMLRTEPRHDGPSAGPVIHMSVHE